MPIYAHRENEMGFSPRRFYYGVGGFTVIDEKTQLGNGLHPIDEALQAGLREGNAGLLSLRDLEARLGDGSAGFYGRLRRFADAPGVGELLGAINVPGAKGVRYEPRSVEIFRRLLAASTANEVTPATAAAWLKLNKDVQPSQAETPIAGTREIAEKTQPGNLAETSIATRLLSGILTPLTGVLGDLASAIRDLKSSHPAASVPLHDRLLTPDQAADLLACRPRSVGRHVAPVSESPRRYRESDVLCHIASLEQVDTLRTNRHDTEYKPLNTNH